MSDVLCKALETRGELGPVDLLLAMVSIVEGCWTSKLKRLIILCSTSGVAQSVLLVSGSQK